MLARLPDAPEGTKGISLFLVPKFLVDDAGGLGARNDVRCESIEHKLGIHASPTCVLRSATRRRDRLDGRRAERGMATMFTMMNQARLAMGSRGSSIAERAYQQALAYARERGRARSGAPAASAPIIEHPDVRRMI